MVKSGQNLLISEGTDRNCSFEKAANDTSPELPSDVLSNPALLFLYYRIEQILGIKAGSEALKNLNSYIEETCGAAFIENPAAYEYLLTSREHIFNISKFLTVNETYFFREGVHFELLVNLLPEFANLKRPVQICSAAVSIGCEAYSIAMLLDYHQKKGFDFDFIIDAFDVNVQAIETAKNARYTSNTLRTDGASWKYILDCYLIQDRNEYIVSQNIRRKVRFFPHNIMRGFERHYDIIFFRNSLIYFSSKNRLIVINNLAESLFNNGILFLGITETASVKHPLLINRYHSDVFYFQKTGACGLPEKPVFSYTYSEPEKNEQLPQKPPVVRENTSVSKEIKETYTRSKDIPVDCMEISDILKTDDGKSNAENVLSKLENLNQFSDINSLDITGSQIAASAVYYLHTENFSNADRIIKFLEKSNSGTFTKFLLGEYNFLRGIFDEAEKQFHEASVKDKFFWPAFYRIAGLAAEGNQTRYEYKIKKAIESIELVQKELPAQRHYECFMGGFSPDYFRRILERKLL